MVAATQRNLDLHPEMRFIIMGQAYRVSNVDNVSIDNVSILSLEDDKLLDTDDRINGIAYTDAYEYSIVNKLTDDLKMYGGDVLELPIVVLKDGMAVEEEIYLESSDENVVEIKGDTLIGRGLGTAVVRASLAKNDTIYLDLNIEVIAEHVPQTSKLYISGSDYLEWNNSETYQLSDGSNAVFEVEKLSKVRSIIDITDNSVTISIKDKYSGTFKITAITPQGVVEKTVYIRTV